MTPVRILSLPWSQGIAAPVAPAPPLGNLFVSPTGSDSNAGSEAHPFATINFAATVVDPGDTVVVENGIWQDTHSGIGGTPSIVELNRGGTAGNPITFRARNRWGAKLDGQTGVAHQGFNYRGAIQYVNLWGFDIYGMSSTPTGSASAIEMFAGGANSTVADCHIHDIGRICTENGNGLDGIFIERDNITIERCDIHDIGRFSPLDGCSYSVGFTAYQSNDHGIYCDDGDNTLIRNNHIYNCKAGWGIQLYSHNHTNMRIVNNTFAFGNPWRHQSFILFGVPETNCKIGNNIFYDPIAGEPVHYLFLSGTATLSNNVTTGAAMVDQVNGSMTFTSNQLSTNALLVNPPTDFKLQAGSPAIDAGENLADVLTDYDGLARPAGAAYDVGAHER